MLSERKRTDHSDLIKTFHSLDLYSQMAEESYEHYPTVLRYVERNPLRAHMVQRSQDWEWSSLKPSGISGPAGLLHDGPVLKRLSGLAMSTGSKQKPNCRPCVTVLLAVTK